MDTGDSGQRVLCDPAAPRRSVGRQAGPSHNCRICGRIYERADHLNRHLKSHENARQFKCTECTKTFNRADLLSRHRAKHSGSTGTISINKRADRAAIACVSCISAKVKCQDNKPCMRCTNKRISCEVPSSDSHGHPFKANTNSASRRVTQLRSVTLEPEAAPPDLARYIDDQGAEDSNDHRMNSERSTTDKDLVLYSHHPAFPNIYAPQDNFTTFADESLNTFPFYSATGNFDQNIPFIPGGFSHDLDINFWDVDFSTVELAHQDTLRGVEEQAQAQPGQNEESWVRRDASKRHAAFERSPWLFTPTPNDHALNDQANLTVDENSIPAALSPSDEISHSDHIHCCIDSNTRDKILSLLLSMRRDINQVRTFPSLDLINNIIRIFFTQELLRTHCLIHTGTFYSSKSLPQLLLAIIALGASYISVPSIWKMGVALQEVVRHTVSDLWEQNNSNIRNLQTLQAFMMCLDIGLWCGFQRQMEIAESFAQPVVVMIRRSGAMGRQRYVALSPSENDTPSTVESKWKKWVEEESFKRLIIHLFIHDTGASIGMQKPPLMSLTEFKFPLPASRGLWLAKSAKEWRELYHSAPAPTGDILTFADVMQNIDNLESTAELVDRHLCVEAILHGYWGQIWSYHESKRFYPESKAAHRLCLMTAQKEMYRDLVGSSAHISSLTKGSPMIALISELLMMLLHADPDQLQRFAGKYGEDEAKHAASGFREWAQNSDSRIAIWHAGQVFAVANKFPTARLQGFSAVAVYYASLTLWIYGLMSASNSLPAFSPGSNMSAQRTTSASLGSEEQITLNEPETAQSRRFLSSGGGRPVLSVMSDSGENIFVPLEASDRMLKIARDIYKANFPVDEAPLPPLVANLRNLLRDLSSLPRSRSSRATSEAAGGPN